MIFEIYADIFFIVNFFMNVSILWVSYKISKSNVKLKKIIIGSLIMTIFYMIMLFNSFLNRYYGIISGQIILAIGVYFVFRPNKINDLIIHIIRTNITAILFSGVVFLISELRHNSIYKAFSFKIMIISSICIYICTIIFRKFIFRTLNSEKFCEIEIFFNDKIVKTISLIDTGNELKDPITGHCAIIVQSIDVVSFFDNDTAHKILKNSNPYELIGEIANSEIISKIRLIPFKTISTENGIMIGFVCDKIKIILSNGKEREIKNVSIGLYNGSISPKGLYRAIIGYEICNF